MSEGVRRIAEERDRQVREKGYTLAWDPLCSIVWPEDGRVDRGLAEVHFYRWIYVWGPSPCPTSSARIPTRGHPPPPLAGSSRRLHSG